VEKMFLLRVETVMKMGFFGGLQKGISGKHVFNWFCEGVRKRESLCEVGLVGGHLKTSIFSFFPFSLYLSFVFCFSST